MRDIQKSLAEIEETRRKYLRWSIPSLALAMIAGSFTVASYLAQKRVIPRYEKLVAEYMEANRGKGELWSESDMRRAEIAAKRLVVENPYSAQRILQSARIGLVSYERIQNAIASHADKRAEILTKWNELAVNAKARAIQSMQRATKLEGADALQARHWLLDWSFRSMRDRSADMGVESPESMKQCEELIAMGVPAKLLFADMMIHRALRFPEQEKWNEIHASMQRARKLLDQERLASLERNASQVEISAVLEHKRANVEAIKFVSESVRDIKQIPWDWRAREAIFRLRLYMGNPAEAFDFAWTSLADMPAAEREIFRWNVAASSLRAMVVQLHQSDPQAKRNVPLLFSFAVKFAPDSPQLVQVIRLLLENNVDAVGHDWLETMRGGHEPGISDWIDWVRSVAAEDAIAATNTTRELPRLDPSFVPGAIVAIRVARQRTPVEHSTLMRMLDSLLEADPENSSLQRISEELMNAKNGTTRSAMDSQKLDSKGSQATHEP